MRGEFFVWDVLYTCAVCTIYTYEVLYSIRGKCEM